MDLKDKNKIYKGQIAAKKPEELNDSIVEYKKLYEKTLKELEDYKGSRLKYKRLASLYEYKYKKLNNMFIVKFYLTFKKPFEIFNKFNVPFSKKLDKEKTKIVISEKKENNFSRESVFECKKIKEFAFMQNTKSPVTLIYADLNINVVDGSSIWLSSVVSLFNAFTDVIVVSKYNIVNDLITSNFKKSQYRMMVLEPKDIGFHSDGLSASEVNQALQYIDELVPSIQNLLVRGMEILEEIVQTNNFKNRLIPYVTNFYSQKTGTPQIIDGKHKVLSSISHQAKVWLWQTEEIRKLVEQNVYLSNKQYILFPPILYDEDFKRNNKKRKNKEHIVIGYAGKIQPDWGVLELIEETEKLNKMGYKIKLRIISSKISNRSTIISGAGFAEKVKEYLKKDFIEYIYDVNRSSTIELLSDVDYIWSYRAAEFENSTLELSTKLLEGVALGLPLISYPSSIHKRVLGEKYPYFISEPSELKMVLDSSIQYENDKLAKHILSTYSLSARLEVVKSLVDNVKNQMLVFAGHDFKFIDHFISHLKSKGILAYKDMWEWGTHDLLKRSETMYKQADTIFCEWGLANAVWYSHKNIEKKPLYLRIHAQEVRNKAMKFGKQINYENITKAIYVSEKIQKKSLELFDIKEDQTILIPNYVLTDDFKFVNNKHELGLNFGVVGITPQSKRLDRALDLMEAVLKIYPKAKLYIKGHRPEKYEWMHAPGRVKELDYYYKQYARLENDKLLGSAVIFNEFGNDMPEWYQKIDFILSLSDHESFHYALADGVASGCLPIVWNWEGVSSIYTDSWVVGSEMEAIAKIKNSLSLTRNELIKTKEKNRNLIVDRYGYEKIFNQLVEHIRISFE